jgi:hypothetical protein
MRRKWRSASLKGKLTEIQNELTEITELGEIKVIRIAWTLGHAGSPVRSPNGTRTKKFSKEITSSLRQNQLDK